MKLLNLFLVIILFISISEYVLSIGNVTVPEHFYYENRSKIELSNGTVNYQLHGESNDGPISVCLHCFMGTLSDCSSISKSLAQNGFKALRFDFYGHGLSHYKKFGHYTLDDYVDQLVEILEKLGLYNFTHVENHELIKQDFVPKLYVIGISLGALVGMRFGRRFPKHINKLVLDAPPALAKKKIAPYLRYSVLNYSLQLIANIYSPVWACYQFMDPPTENLVSPKFDFRANHYCKQVLLTSLQLILGVDLWDNVEIFKQMSEVQVETLFFWGLNDGLCLLSSAIVILNEYLPNSKITVYENCKHRCSRHCKDRFVSDVLKIFKNQSDVELVSVSQYYNSIYTNEKFSAKKSSSLMRGSTLEPANGFEDLCQGSSENVVKLISEEEEQTEKNGLKSE